MISLRSHGVGTRLANDFGLSRQVANGYLQAMVRDGLIEAEGTTRARTYQIKALAQLEKSHPREGLQEDIVWRELIAPLVAEFAGNVRDIWSCVYRMC